MGPCGCFSNFGVVFPKQEKENLEGMCYVVYT